jgi:LacI family transcriptional regulator
MFGTTESEVRTRTIGVIAHDLTKSPINLHGYYRNILDGVLESAFFRGWSAHLFVEQMWDDIGTAIRHGYDGRCDGVVYVAPGLDNQLIPTLHDRGIPMVLVGTSSFLPDVSSVDIDNEGAGSLLTRHLLNLGHEKFVFIANWHRAVSADERFQGMMRALRDAGVPSDHIETILDNDTLEASVKSILGRPEAERPTAFFGWNDHIAMIAMGLAQSLGFHVPKDLSFVGVDDDPNGSLTNPKLTTVLNPVVAIGRRAANLLIDKLTNPTQPSETVKFAAELVIRGSTGAVRSNPGVQSQSSIALGTKGGPLSL